MLELAVVETRARRHFNLCVVSGNLVASLSVPGPACDVEHAWIRAIIVTAEPSAFGIEPVGWHAIVGTIGDFARLGAGNIGRHAILMP